MKPIILIPSRMASTRLPGKPLADIAGLPMIVQVWKRAMESGAGPVVVAAAEKEIVKVIEDQGGEAVLTRPDWPSGSDRIFEALTKVDPGSQYDTIINLQGDLPTLDPSLVSSVLLPLSNPSYGMSTLVTPITDPEDEHKPHIVKAVVDFGLGKPKVGRALYFSRARVPTGASVFYHHIGIYAYRREVLARFVLSKPSPAEQAEKLEQLRALSLGVGIGACEVDTIPLGVDTPEDLEKARAILAKSQYA